MMLVSFADERCSWGVCADGARVVPGWQLLSGRFATLRSVIAAGKVEAALDAAAGMPGDLVLADLALLPVIPDADHVYCCGLNFSDHASETGKDVPEAPRIFSRLNSSLTGHMGPLVRPAVSRDFDFEGEIAVVIGTGGRHIPEAQAMAHVAGYTCFMDGSVRDWQKWTTTLGKTFWRTGALGPGLVPARAVPDWTRLRLTTRLNGAVMQQVGADLMIHTIPALIAFLSKMSPLMPGDVIATGTPKGIGCRREPPVWLCPGDVIEVEISDVGILRNTVTDETV